jgi:ribosome biogenesis GTPase / thiamine phosphate phosphatase
LQPVILCNKIDLLDDASIPDAERERERELMLECKKIYAAIDIPFLPISCETRDGLDELIAIMKDKISVFSGQSGAGKSSLINATCDMNLKVRKTVQSSKKGAHTTSYAELIHLPFGGYVVDTPGIKSFGVWNLTLDELPMLFPEIADAGCKCKFQDCIHRGETGCYLPEAVEKGLVSPLRYESYLTLLSSIESEHMRR